LLVAVDRLKNLLVFVGLSRRRADAERVDRPRQFLGQNFVDPALCCEAVLPFERSRYHDNFEMRLPFGAGANMSGMQMGLIDNLQMAGRQLGGQLVPDGLRDGHGAFSFGFGYGVMLNDTRVRRGQGFVDASETGTGSLARARKYSAGRDGAEALRLEGLDVGVSTRFCDVEGCTEEAQHRAPKSPGRLTDYFWFCLEHVRTYNKSWNYYANMSDDEVEAAIRRATTWERPSWRFGARRNDGRAFDPSRFRDDFGLFDEERPGGSAGSKSERRNTATPEARAAAVMGLTLPVTMQELKVRYKELAKLNHPDRNGGDKEAEERLKLINEAYTTLKRFLN
jgi:hypothetical protein